MIATQISEAQNEGRPAVAEMHLCDAGPLGYAFDARWARATVITHGRAELR